MRAKQVCVITAGGERVCGRPVKTTRPSGSAADPHAPAVERFVPLTRADGVVLLFRGDPRVLQGHMVDHAREYGVDANEYTRFHRSLDSALARLEGRYVYVIPVAPNGRTVPSDFSIVRNGKLMAVPGHRASGKAGFWSSIFGSAEPKALGVGDYVADEGGVLGVVDRFRPDGTIDVYSLANGTHWYYQPAALRPVQKPFEPGDTIVANGKRYTVREHTNERKIRVVDADGRRSEVRAALAKRA